MDRELGWLPPIVVVEVGNPATGGRAQAEVARVRTTRPTGSHDQLGVAEKWSHFGLGSGVIQNDMQSYDYPRLCTHALDGRTQ
nr:hypothetical protein [Microbacterium sp.]